MEPELHKFDFFSQAFKSHRVDNFFFAASAGHPILKEWLNIMEGNFNNPAPYIQKTLRKLDLYYITTQVTADLSFIAFYKAADIGNFTNVVYPTNCAIYLFEGMSEQMKLKKREFFPNRKNEDVDNKPYKTYVSCYGEDCQTSAAPVCIRSALVFGQDDLDNNVSWM